MTNFNRPTEEIRFTRAALCAIGASCVFHLLFMFRPLYGHYDIDGQLYFLLARSFLKYGYFKLGFIPVINSGPLTNPPDYYAHWPVLYPLLLSSLIKIFGYKIYIGRIITIVSATFVIYFLFRLVKLVFDAKTAFFSTIAYILMPMNLYYGFWINRTYPSLCLWILGIYCFLLYDHFKGEKFYFLILAGVSLFIASLTSWEPVMTVGGFGFLILTRKESWFRKGAIFCSSALILAFLLHHIHVFLVAPALLKDQVAAALQRGGVSLNGLPQRPLLNWIFLTGWHGYLSFGLTILLGFWLGVLYFLKQWREQSSGSMLCLVLLISMPLLWFLFMPRQAFDHDYECLLIGPAVALLVGSLGAKLYRLRHRTLIKILLICVAISLSVEGSVGFTRYYSEFDDTERRLLELKDHLKETDVLLQTGWQVSTAYHTERHVVPIQSKGKLIEYIRHKSPRWATAFYFIEYMNNVKTTNEGIRQKSLRSENSFLNFMRDKLRALYIPLEWPQRSNENNLMNYIRDNFPKEITSSGIVIYDLQKLEDNIAK